VAGLVAAVDWPVVAGRLLARARTGYLPWRSQDLRPWHQSCGSQSGRRFVISLSAIGRTAQKSRAPLLLEQ